MFFDDTAKIRKTDKLPARLTVKKKKKKKKKPNIGSYNIKNERKLYSEQLHVPQFDMLYKINQFLKNHRLSKLTLTQDEKSKQSYN